jgi:hypothetical protein
VKRSTKAVLLSGLVFPGFGHLYLKQFVVGILLACGSASALYWIVSSAVSKALEIAETIQSQGAPLDIDAIGSLVSEQSRAADSASLSIATIALIAFWVIGIVDSYRVGRLVDKGDEATVAKKT